MWRISLWDQTMSEWPGRALSENHSSSNRTQQASQNGIEGKKDDALRGHALHPPSGGFNAITFAEYIARIGQPREDLDPATQMVKDEIGWVTEMRDEWMKHADVLKDEIARLTELEDKWMKSIDGVRKMEAELTELRGKLKKSMSNLFLTSSQ